MLVTLSRLHCLVPVERLERSALVLDSGEFFQLQFFGDVTGGLVEGEARRAWPSIVDLLASPTFHLNHALQNLQLLRHALKHANVDFVGRQLGDQVVC